MEEAYAYDSQFVTDEQLRELAEQYGTPYFLYNEAGICEDLEQLCCAYRWNPGFREFFPAFCLPYPQMAKLFLPKGIGLCCMDGKELAFAEQWGFPGSQILFSPIIPSADETQLAKKLGAAVTFDNLDSLHNVLQDYCPQMCVLRLGIYEKIRVGGIAVVRGGKSKLGMTLGDFFQAVNVLQDCGVKSIGLEISMNQMVMEAGLQGELLRHLLLCAAKVQERGMLVTACIIGGGIGICYKPGTPELSWTQISKQTQAVYEEQLAALDLPEMPFQTILGKSLVAHHGILVSKVLLTKELERSYAILDAVTTEQTCSGLNSYHHISVVGKRSKHGRRFWDIVGRFPGHDERFGERRLLPGLQPGDLCVIHDVGYRSPLCLQMDPQKILVLQRNGEIRPIASLS